MFRVATIGDDDLATEQHVISIPVLVAWFSLGPQFDCEAPGGLAFSEFKGYEDWQTVAVSRRL